MTQRESLGTGLVGLPIGAAATEAALRLLRRYAPQPSGEGIHRIYGLGHLGAHLQVLGQRLVELDTPWVGDERPAKLTRLWQDERNNHTTRKLFEAYRKELTVQYYHGELLRATSGLNDADHQTRRRAEARCADLVLTALTEMGADRDIVGQDIAEFAEVVRELRHQCFGDVN